jgi:AcrR family transcriptional regulator
METIAGGPAARPLRRDAERNRRRILDAAGALFAERGLGVSLDDIAARAEVGVGTVYRRFPDKDVLIDALFDEQLDTVVGIAEEALAIEDPWDGLEHFLRTALERQARNRGLKELLLGARTGDEVGCAAAGRVRIEPLVIRLVERARAAGAIRDDVATTDLPLIQLMVGAVVDYTRDVDPDVWRRLLALVLDGLRAAPEVRTPFPAAPLSSDDLTRAMSNWCPRST